MKNKKGKREYDRVRANSGQHHRVLLVAAVFLPDIFAKDTKKEETEEETK